MTRPIVRLLRYLVAGLIGAAAGVGMLAGWAYMETEGKWPWSS